jgi:hypothetical protein
MVFSFPVITFGVITVIAGGAAVLMPMVRARLARSRRRRRSKNRRDRQHTPRQRIDIVAAPAESAPSAEDSG